MLSLLFIAYDAFYRCCPQLCYMFFQLFLCPMLCQQYLVPYYQYYSIVNNGIFISDTLEKSNF